MTTPAADQQQQQRALLQAQPCGRIHGGEAHISQAQLQAVAPGLQPGTQPFTLVEVMCVQQVEDSQQPLLAQQQQQQQQVCDWPVLVAPVQAMMTVLRDGHIG